jgi:formamidopyrimidine-DNA glycosylase
VYGKVGTSASAFQNAMTGKKIVGVKQQGKYFWLEMDSPPHPLMHFGMSGWMKFSTDHTSYYRPTKPEENEWPPRFWKFILQLKDDPCEVAFVDPRRLGRIRLVDTKAEDMRKTSPLKENGPDPVIDKDILTVEWLTKKLRSKKVPIKALLLDQANISGIGNWVGYVIHIQLEYLQLNALGTKYYTKLVCTQSNTATRLATHKSNNCMMPLCTSVPRP